MGNSSDEIARQIAETRDGIEDKILTLRERGEIAVRRSKRALLIAAGVGAAAAIAVVGGIAIYRMTRPVTRRERIQRVIPPTWWERAKNLRDSWELGVRKQVPPLRVFVGDKQVGEEPPANTTQKIALRVAQAAGTAIGGAIVQRVMSRFDRSDAASTG
ncbi:MAG: hypothetical protein M3Z98_02360 [Candidatus Dormibacteraeota bacterium]|nr:hypothetical protein [Candidatus Dormibacteraeota bacterium]